MENETRNAVVDNFLDEYRLPCDVRLPPATIIRKGCRLGALLLAMNAREGMALEWHHDDK